MKQQSNLPGRAVYLIDGARTPFLKARNRPGPFSATDLAVQCGRPLLLRQAFDPEVLDEVIIGCVSSGPDEANIARVISLRLGCATGTPAWTVQRNCASGMQALDSAGQSIASGRSDLILAGGTEAMSHHPVLLNLSMLAWLGGWRQARTLSARARQLARLRPHHFQLVIALLRGLTDLIVGLSMGQTAEQLAWEFGIEREEMDAYAAGSHRRLSRAREAGWLDEIEPIIADDGTVYRHDDGLREDTDRERLGQLRAVFDRPAGKVTAGNSAQITDGAALLILASDAAVQRYGLTPRAKLIDSQWAGLNPEQMGLGPVHAMSALLQRQNLTSRDIDAWEINEAFAGQVLACLKAWRSEEYCQQNLGMGAFSPIDEERLNLDGGALSIGHPVGASGARIVLHLLHVLERTNASRGMASLCVGGGQGGAMLLERPNEVAHE